MNFVLKEYIAKDGKIILYTGTPNFYKLEILSAGVGDIWHSSFEQGYKNAFPEIAYQTATFFWFVRDFDNLKQCISWRINPFQFAIRKSVWETLGGFDSQYNNPKMQAFDFGFNALRFLGAVPLYVHGLFEVRENNNTPITAKDRHTFFRQSVAILTYHGLVIRVTLS